MGVLATRAKECRVTLTWSSSVDSWQTLRLELEREAEAIFASSGEVLVVTPDRESGSVMTLSSRTRSLRLTYFPDRNAVRRESDNEYSFERIPEQMAALARNLVQRVRQ
jgi:hypothetical protein